MSQIMLDLFEKNRQIEKLGTIIDAKHRYAYRMAELLRELRWHHAECIECGGHQHQGGCDADCRVESLLAEWDASGAG